MNVPTIFELHGLLFNEDIAFEFLCAHRIIESHHQCVCGKSCVLDPRRKTYRCGGGLCRKEVSCFKDSFFSKSKLGCSKSLLFGYLWLTNCTHTTICAQLGLSSATVTNYIRFFRELVADSLDDDDFVIGGPGIRVEIDESKLGKRKYHRGHRVDGVWVLGGVEHTAARKVFIEIVETRDAETLQDVIVRHVLPGSIVVTDFWRGYLGLEELGYTHLRLNHSLEFVDPVTGACTNTIEGTWSSLKGKIPVRNRTSSCEDNLFEFIWRRKNSHDLWGGLISALREIKYE
jgi:hypothetical protein